MTNLILYNIKELNGGFMQSFHGIQINHYTPSVQDNFLGGEKKNSPQI